LVDVDYEYPATHVISVLAAMAHSFTHHPDSAIAALNDALLLLAHFLIVKRPLAIVSPGAHLLAPYQ